jgi:hypothetical protein
VDSISARFLKVIALRNLEGLKGVTPRFFRITNCNLKKRSRTVVFFSIDSPAALGITSIEHR